MSHPLRERSFWVLSPTVRADEGEGLHRCFVFEVSAGSRKIGKRSLKFLA